MAEMGENIISEINFIKGYVSLVFVLKNRFFGEGYKIFVQRSSFVWIKTHEKRFNIRCRIKI